MARRSPHTAAYEDYSIKDEDRDDATFLGTIGDGVAMLYHEASHAVFRGDPDDHEETIEPVEGSHRELHDDETVGDEVRRVHEEHGWESVSSVAERHLDDPDESDDRS